MSEEEEEDVVNKNMKETVEYMNYSPLMFTAPHGMQIFRGGVEQGDRIHEKELGGDSWIIWNEMVAKPLDHSNLDPNYLYSHQYDQSPFHVNLREWKNIYNDSPIPLIHFDVHGKKTRKHKRIELDIGVRPLLEIFPDRQFGILLRDTLAKEIRESFKFVNRRRRKQKVAEFLVIPNPTLHGLWPCGKKATLSHQGVLLGIPAVQFEIPPIIRKRLVNDKKFLERFGESLIRTYETVFGTSREIIKERLRKFWVEKRKKEEKEEERMDYNHFLQFLKRKDFKRDSTKEF